MKINWAPPEPRQGLAGAWDKFVGPGATTAELWLQLIPPLAAAVALPLYAIGNDLGWTTWRLIVAALLAFDLTGGIVTNATSTAKRWYHRQGQGFAQHFGFVAVHAAQLFLVAWLFWGMDWAYFFSFYGYLLLATVVILWVPLYLQRPLAMIFFSMALLMNSYLCPPPAGMEWFIPFFFLKLLVSHLLKEAPFRPADEMSEQGSQP